MLNSALQVIIRLNDLLKSNYHGIINFYNMNWYGFEIGKYMSWIGLGGLAIVIAEIYLEYYLATHKNKNDVRRFQENANRGKMV